jgi:hypothetical protein
MLRLFWEHIRAAFLNLLTRKPPPPVASMSKPIQGHDPGDYPTAEQFGPLRPKPVETIPQCPRCKGIDVVVRNRDVAIWCHGCQNVFHPATAILR